MWKQFLKEAEYLNSIRGGDGFRWDPFNSLLFFVAGMALQAFVLTCLWAWFIVPTFGLPALTLIQAVGVMVVKGFVFTSRLNIEEFTKGNVPVHDRMFRVGLALMALGIGWIVSLFM